MIKSVWQDSVKMPVFKKHEGDTNTDVLIVGGGICGILCAYFLKLRGVDYILVEGGTIAEGTTKNTTAKITSQHGLIYDKLIKKYGAENAQVYFKANESAIAKYKEIAQKTECDFEEKDAYVYSLSDRLKIEDEVRAVNSLGGCAEFTERTELPFPVKGAVRFTGQAQFNPLKFLAGISENLNIYEHTYIKEIQGDTAIHDRGRIKARKMIIATHFPFLNGRGFYFLKLYQQRSYVIAVSGTPDLNGMYIDEAENGMSFRNYKDLMFVGGGDHRTGKNGGNWSELRKFIKEYYPSAEERYIWSAQDCMSLDGIPYIGNYSKNTPDLYVASGFNKWGITASMVAADILSRAVIGEESEFSRVYSSLRGMALPQLLVNGFETTVNLLTPTLKRCPHLGCALKWNKSEHTWDCPCHGSRFSKNGELIDNPAMRDANVNR